MDVGYAMDEGKIAVYTVIIGDGYVLPEVNRDDDADYLCFTDQSDLQPNGWSLIHCEALLPLDLPRSSREQKLRPHRYLQSYQRSIYVDPSVCLTQPAEEVWRYLIPDEGTVLGCFWHSFRETLSDEIDAVRSGGLEHDYILSELQELIENRYMRELKSRPFWGGFMARRHMSPVCVDAMEQWFAYVLRYSRRDQLTMPLVMTKIADDLVFVRKEDIFHSPIHNWPVKGYSRPDRYYRGYTNSATKYISDVGKKAHFFSVLEKKFGLVLEKLNKR